MEDLDATCSRLPLSERELQKATAVRVLWHVSAISVEGWCGKVRKMVSNMGYIPSCKGT